MGTSTEPWDEIESIVTVSKESPDNLTARVPTAEELGLSREKAFPTFAPRRGDGSPAHRLVPGKNGELMVGYKLYVDAIRKSRNILERLQFDDKVRETHLHSHTWRPWKRANSNTSTRWTRRRVTRLFLSICTKANVAAKAADTALMSWRTVVRRLGKIWFIMVPIIFS